MIGNFLDSESLYQFYLTGNRTIVNLLETKIWRVFDVEIDMGETKISWPSILKRLYNLERVKMNISYVAPSTLNCHSYHTQLFESGSTQFESLKSLVLTHLKFTQLNTTTRHHLDDRTDNKIFCNWQSFRQLNFTQLFPNLRSLTFHVDHVKFTNDNVRSLPSTLMSLSLAKHGSRFDFGNLPRSLQKLILFGNINMRYGNNSFRNLPPHLKTLRLTGIQSVLWDDFAYLPTTLTSLRLGRPNSNRSDKIPFDRLQILPHNLEYIHISLQIDNNAAESHCKDLLPFPKLRYLVLGKCSRLNHMQYQAMFSKTVKPLLKVLEIGNDLFMCSYPSTNLSPPP
jgi:hypothetical protein